MQKKFRRFLHGEPDMARISYEWLVYLAIVLLIVPPLVSEILAELSISESHGIGNIISTAIAFIVTSSFFLANIFVARTYAHSQPTQKWPPIVATLSAVLALANFLPGLLEGGSAFERWEVIGDIGFIGMGSISAYAIWYDLISTRTVRAREVYGSVGLYLMFGLLFSFVYGIVGTLNINSFSLPMSAGVNDRPELIYYSFATQLTIGYGDITPTSQLARSISILQGGFGVLYPPIIVARLVNLYLDKD